MATEKENIMQLIKELPDDVTLDDIMYHLYVKQKILRGLEDIKQGKLHNHAAKSDLKGIIEYLSQDSPQYAEYLYERIFESIDNLKSFRMRTIPMTMDFLLFLGQYLQEQTTIPYIDTPVSSRKLTAV
jgi:hypothetical protein